MNDYSYIDIALTVLAVLLAVRGFLRGFVKEFFSLGTPVIGIFAAFLFYKNGGAFLREHFAMNINGLPEILAFILIFIIIFLVGRIVRKILSDVINGMHLTSLDKLLGGILGIIEGLAAIALVLFVISMLPIENAAGILAGSLYGQILLPLISGPVQEGAELLQNTTALYLPSRAEFRAAASALFVG